MAASDPVLCYYSGQNYRWENPAKVLTRGEVRQLKNAKVGKFIENGKIFLFFKTTIAAAAERLFDGPIGVGNLLPFAKPRCDGAKLHYELPPAGERTPYQRSRRKLIKVSSRPVFSQPGVQWANYVSSAIA